MFFNRREIERSEYAEAVERNKVNYESNASLYRQRQEINEHIFGTIKRQWNIYYTNLRGLEKVNGEVALIMLVYNMKRVQNILGFKNLMEKLSNGRRSTQVVLYLLKIDFISTSISQCFFLLHYYVHKIRCLKNTL